MLLLAQAAAADVPLRGLDAIREGNGVAITITGLLIVFVALTAVSLFIGALPRLLDALGPYLPEIESHHDQPTNNGRGSKSPPAAGTDPRLIAAIGWAMHNRRPP
ncbi:MAG: OadG family transporter subunit, partial [Planctomycetota bacterium]